MPRRKCKTVEITLITRVPSTMTLPQLRHIIRTQVGLRCELDFRTANHFGIDQLQLRVKSARLMTESSQ